MFSNMRFLKALIGSIVVCWVVIGVIWGLTLRQKSRAEQFLQQLTNLELGKSTFAEAQQIALKYRGFPWYADSGDMRCTFQRCELRFIFQNKPLTSFHLARYVELIAVISVKDGIIVGRDVVYARETGRYFPFQYNVIDRASWNDGPVSNINQTVGLARLKVNDTGIPSTVMVRLGPSSTADQRNRAYAFNLSCLARFLDCDDPSAFFPSGIPYRGEPSQTHSENW
jgi:hypothetical protein